VRCVRCSAPAALAGLPPFSHTLLGEIFPMVAQFLIFLLLLRLSPIAGYHAAEHQVVHALERSEPLVVETVRAMPRVHPRCGTNLVAGALLLTLGAAVFAPLLRRLLGDSDGEMAGYILAIFPALVWWRSVGGWLQQHFTTRPATDAQIESGIRAARELLRAHDRAPFAPLRGRRVLLRFWRMGFLQIMGGFSAGLGLLKLLTLVVPALRPLWNRPHCSVFERAPARTFTARSSPRMIKTNWFASSLSPWTPAKRRARSRCRRTLSGRRSGSSRRVTPPAAITPPTSPSRSPKRCGDRRARSPKIIAGCLPVGGESVVQATEVVDAGFLNFPARARLLGRNAAGHRARGRIVGPLERRAKSPRAAGIRIRQPPRVDHGSARTGRRHRRRAWPHFTRRPAGGSSASFTSTMRPTLPRCACSPAPCSPGIVNCAGRDDPVPDDGYGAEYVVEIAREIFAHAGNRYADLMEAEALPVFENLAMRALRAQQESALAAFGIRFDNWHSEADLHRSGAVTKTLAALKNAGHAYEQGGALWLRSTAFGDDKDRVLARGESGESATYIAGDLAYHEEKFGRGFDALVDVFPSDHAGYVARTQAGLAALGRDSARLHIVVYQPVRLIQQGQEARLGKQAGDFVTLSELVDEVGRDAARFFFLLRAPDEPLDFDLDLARRTDAENPLFYAQYAHARCCSVLQNARHAAAGIPALDLDAADLTLLSDADETALAKRLAEFPDEVRTAVNARAPHRIAQYVLDVAAKFHAYHDRGSRDAALRPLLPDTPDQTLARLVLTQAVRLTLANAFALLGVSAPVRMPREEEEEDRDEPLSGNNDDAFPLRDAALTLLLAFTIPCCCHAFAAAAPGVVSQGAFTDAAGAKHVWRINGAHTLIWDGEAYLPVGGRFQARSWVAGAGEADWQADVAALKTLKEKGVADLLLQPAATPDQRPTGITRVAPAALQRLMDHLDAEGFTYGVSLNDGPRDPLIGYVVRPGAYRRGEVQAPQGTILRFPLQNVGSSLFFAATQKTAR
jgi:hypothetical protein